MSNASTRAGAADPRLDALARLVAVVDRLRAEDGCPWDRAQTLATMAPYLVEEAHEALEAIETKGDLEIAEEAGDLLMVVCLVCKIAEQEGRFDLGLAAQRIADKLVRRHPHVFGETKAGSPAEALKTWEAIKKKERADEAKDASALAGVPAALPALQRAHRVCGKATSAGFRWTDASGAAAKLAEEQVELAEALAEADAGVRQGSATAAIEHELGDVLLSAAFLASYLGLDPERLCRDAIRRFERRFRAMEGRLVRPMRELSLGELVAAWDGAKEEVS